ncbi:hypothetical protein Lal_00000542 [Lupinus albus]|nr:hypothetical protein Lal_00000542 [Lupinus albus]
MYLRGPMSTKLPERMQGTNFITADSRAASKILSPGLTSYMKGYLGNLAHRRPNYLKCRPNYSVHT